MDHLRFMVALTILQLTKNICDVLDYNEINTHSGCHSINTDAGEPSAHV